MSATSHNFIDLRGSKFGRLTVLDRGEDSVTPGGDRKARWVCACECGATKIVTGCSLRAGNTASCGCKKREMIAAGLRTSHGHAGGGACSPTYLTRQAMIQRCHNPNHEKWPTYGGRGIAVCERWRKSFADFLADMGERPVGTTIERIDVTGNYEPGNCRWATSREQHSNKRNSRKITIRGETLCLAEWEERSGTNRETISKRIARGINPESAVFSPAYRSA